MTEEAERSGWYIPWLFVGFFVVIFITNGIFLYFAISTHSGVETVSAYEEGLRYNEKLAAARQETVLGWAIAIDARRNDAGETSLVVTLTDSDGNPIDDSEVTARFVRPVSDDVDIGLTLKGHGAGRYGAEINIPYPGQWDIRVLIEKGENSARMSKRVVL